METLKFQFKKDHSIGGIAYAAGDVAELPVNVAQSYDGTPVGDIVKDAPKETKAAQKTETKKAE